MFITIIAAMADNRVIGKDGAIPWHVPADLARFKSLTTGHPVIMGRKTFASIGRPLPGRLNIILSLQEKYQPEGCLVARSPEEALALAGAADEVFICGGGEVYRKMLPLANRIDLTVVHLEAEGDTFFPALPDDFVEMAREECASDPPCTFIRYERKRPSAIVHSL